MRLEDLLPYVATLGLLALWAITHLFNREDQPLPPRAARPQNGGGGARPQPMAGPPRRVEPPMRWSPPPGSNPTNRGSSGRPVRLDDDIVIIDAEPPKRPAVPARPANAPAGRRPARGRAGGSGGAKPQEAKAAKPLSAPLSTPLAPLSTRPVEFKPLSLPQENLAAQESTKKASAASASKAIGGAGLPTLDIPALVKSPERVLQSVILSEILQPPVALRNRRR